MRSLFLIQFLLGAAVAFLSTASLALFLTGYAIQMLPVVYVLAGACLLLINYTYTRLEARHTPGRLLQRVILFSMLSVLACWLVMALLSFSWLVLVLVIWSLVIYMLVSESFWGMVALMFNVREGKRLAAVIGAGDLPAKMLGYLSVTALVPFIGVVNLLWVSVGCFMAAYFLFHTYRRRAGAGIEEAAPDQAAVVHHKGSKSFVRQYFHNTLILSIGIWALIGYAIFFIIDYTFLAEIKLEMTSSTQLATFISVFFAAGRLLAILFKLVFSSKVIARLGLANALLVAPALLFLVNAFILTTGEGLPSYLYVFGTMVLLTEVLRSTLQDPVAFILFQPLAPHSRLKGHAVKWYMLPVGLLVVGAGLSLYLQRYGTLTITTVAEILVVLLIFWAGSTYLIRKAYLRALTKALQKGYFTGTELFLNDALVRKLLVQKTKSLKPLEVIHSLNLLERSGYPGIYQLLLRQLKSDFLEVKEYVISRIMANRMSGALPLLREQLGPLTNPALRPILIKALCYLENSNGTLHDMQHLGPECRKEAMVGFLSRFGEVNPAIERELEDMAVGSVEEKLLALDIISEVQKRGYEHLVELLLQDESPEVYNRAILVAGKLKYFALFKAAVEVAEKRKAYRTLQKALTFFGDDAYREEFVQPGDLSESLVNVLIKAAGKTQEKYATLFLEAALKRYPDKTDLIVEALWEKKAIPGSQTKQLLEAWFARKIDQNLLKRSYYLQLIPDPSARLLQQALCSEINQDLQSILKGLSLVYHRKRIERVIELYKLGYDHMFSNAVEMLELLIPQKYFSSLDTLIEFAQEADHPQVYREKAGQLTTSDIIQEILLDNVARCNSWTRSVACYLIPRLQKGGFPIQILDKRNGNEDYLFRETRSYVLSILPQA